MREINYKELYHLVEKYGKPLDEKDKASRVMDFVRPIPGHQEIRGMRLLNVDGKKALLVLKHDGEGINAKDFKYLGKLQGVEHFAYKAQDWATRNRESTLGMFDIQGHEKWFRDPRLHPDSMDGIQREFDKLVKASLDPTNARRNDPMLADLGLGRDVKIHI